MAAGAEGLNSEHTSLKPFTYPVPETRFFHVGVHVYKFKIKYGNTISVNIDLRENIVSEELEEAVRVILGNLDSLRPFTTEHLVIFPYLNKWERVSDLRFRHGDAFLIPYPYVCTIYIELNSSVFLGEEEFRDTCDSVNSRHKPRDNMDSGRAIKWRRLEGKVEMSHMQLCGDRNVAKNTTCIYNTTKPNVGFGRMQLKNGMIHQTQGKPRKDKAKFIEFSFLPPSPYNHLEELQHQYCGTTSTGYDNMNLWDVRTENTKNSPQKRQVAVLPKRAEETVELKTRGFLELLKSTLFPPLLQRLFSGST